MSNHILAFQYNPYKIFRPDYLKISVTRFLSPFVILVFSPTNYCFKSGNNAYSVRAKSGLYGDRGYHHRSNYSNSEMSSLIAFTVCDLTFSSNNQPSLVSFPGLRSSSLRVFQRTLWPLIVSSGSINFNKNIPSLFQSTVAIYKCRTNFQ